MLALLPVTEVMRHVDVEIEVLSQLGRMRQYFPSCIQKTLNNFLQTLPRLVDQNLADLIVRALDRLGNESGSIK